MPDCGLRDGLSERAHKRREKTIKRERCARGFEMYGQRLRATRLIRRTAHLGDVLSGTDPSAESVACTRSVQVSHQ